MALNGEVSLRASSTVVSINSICHRDREGKALKRTIINISNSGLGIYSFASLAVRDEITVKSALPARHRGYTVRWATKLLDNFYVAGLQCAHHA